MVQVGKRIVYRDEVCTLIEIAKKYKNDEDYYVLQSGEDKSLVIRVPVATAKKMMRPLISKKELNELIAKIPEIETIEVNKQNRGSEYKDLMSKGSHEDVVTVIKTTYLRQQESLEQAYKPNESDKTFFRQAEKRLYSEVAYVLDMSYEDAKEYIVSKVRAVAVAS